MKFNKQKLIKYLLVLYIIITGLFNVYGYFKLPDRISTHFSLSGKSTGSTSSTWIYLIISFSLVLALSIGGMKKEGQQKVKYICADTLIIICNFIIIFSQL
jgi:hypothetical protein